MNKILKATVSSLFLLLLVVASMFGVVSASATLTATPSNSNIFVVTGTGFNATATVTLELMNGSTVVYTFTGSITTNSTGNFSTTVIVPTSIAGGAYTLTASTSGTPSVSQSVSYTIPNLMGATGATGATGSTGATGAPGAIGSIGATGATGVPGLPGKSASNGLVYAAIGIGLVALIVAAISLFMNVSGKMKKTSEEKVPPPPS